MSMDYKQWCENNMNITPLVRALKSSIPEQYLGFYLNKVFGPEIEYHKQFEWLGRSSLDIYIPSLKIAIEYDGVYYHSKKVAVDNQKTSLCRSYGIYVIRIQEKKSTQEKSRKRNEISYYFEKEYKNIGNVIQDLCRLINKKYNTSIQIDVDLERDRNEIITYIQDKYYKKTMAYVWPEIKDYWLEDKNGLTIFDVFYTDNRAFALQCPHCKKQYILYTRYFHNRKSLIPCECEYQEIETSFSEAIRKYKETGEVIVFDNSIHSRRLYDRMEGIVNKIWRCNSKEEAEMYKELGFETPYLDVFLSQFCDS